MTEPQPDPSPKPAQPLFNSSNEKLWNVLCHVSCFLGVGLILPLVIYLVTKDDASTIPQHAKETLNFHISVLIYAIISSFLIVIIIGIPLLGLIAIAALVLSIIGAMKASNNELYHYPLTIRLVK